MLWCRVLLLCAAKSQLNFQVVGVACVAVRKGERSMEETSECLINGGTVGEAIVTGMGMEAGRKG